MPKVIQQLKIYSCSHVSAENSSHLSVPVSKPFWRRWIWEGRGKDEIGWNRKRGLNTCLVLMIIWKQILKINYFIWFATICLWCQNKNKQTNCMSVLKHLAFDQKNSIFLQEPIGILSVTEIFIITLYNLFINYEFAHVKFTWESNFE